MKTNNFRIHRSVGTVFSLLSLVVAGSAQAVSKFDLNATGSPTQEGWVAADLGVGTDGTVSIDTVGLDGVGVFLDSRDRAGANGGGAEAAMWQDFIFGNASFASAPGTGLEITVSGLEPEMLYAFTLWAYDTSSGVQADGFNRAADWTATGEPGRLSFDATINPTSLDDYRIIVMGESDDAGVVVLTGLVAETEPSTSHNVFLNGLEVSDPVIDADMDGMPDDFEQVIIDADDMDALVEVEDVLPEDDFDEDASSNLEEFERMTDPIDEDSDDDGAKDGWENGTGEWASATETGTNPLVDDTDGDGILDGVENRDLPYDPDNPATQPGTDPNLVDTDGDLFSDATELLDGTDPTDAEDFLDPLGEMVAKFDFNAPGSPSLANWTGADEGNGTDGTVTVATEGIGGITLDTRDRPSANTNTGDVARNDLWRDFVFANGSFDSAPGSGLRITLSGLQGSTTYPITIWAFDESSNNGRTADWSQAGEEGATLTFPSEPDPASLNDYMITIEASTDGGGTLVVEGIVALESPSTSHNVFVNALAVGPPTGSTQVVISTVEFDPETGMAALTWNSSPGKLYQLDRSGDLINFEEVDDAVLATEGSTTTRYEFDAGIFGDRSFYRVTEVPGF